MRWFKKKDEQPIDKIRAQFIAMTPPPTPKHIVPIKDLVIFAENAFNEGNKEIEADALRSLINHINRYLDKN